MVGEENGIKYKGEQLEKEMKEMFRVEDPDDDEGNSNIEINLNPSELVVGDFVLVNYEEDIFPEIVLKKDDEVDRTL